MKKIAYSMLLVILTTACKNEVKTESTVIDEVSKEVAGEDQAIDQALKPQDGNVLWFSGVPGYFQGVLWKGLSNL